MSVTAETRAEGLSHARARLTPRMTLIIGALRDGPKTAAEVADSLGFRDLNAVRPRLHELEELEVVRVIGKRTNPRSGVNNAIYELIEKAPASGANTDEGTGEINLELRYHRRCRNVNASDEP